MSDSENLSGGSGRRFPFGINFLGILLVLCIVLTTLAIGINATRANRLTSSTPPAVDPAVTIPALAKITPKREVIEPPPTLGASHSNLLEGPVPTAPVTPKPTTVVTPFYDDLLTDGSDKAILVKSRPDPLPTPHETFSWTLKVPILMYHYISNPPENSDEYRQDLSVSPDNFRQQVQYLLDNGYTIIDLYDLSLAITDKIQLPEKAVVITLDDGYRDNYENAFPILRDLGVKATFFVVTEFVDYHNPNYMDWGMLEEMAAAGMRIEPHSKTHPDLTQHDRDFIVWEVLGSAETIEAHTGSKPRYFAYPGGRYDEATIAIVQELDFWGAVTTEHGEWHGFNDRYQWSRVRVRNVTSIEEFANLLD